VDRWNESWRDDEFVLDPTRVTLYIGNTGLNGYEFREEVLMGRFGIQINKTSINSVLLIFTIGVTWSSVHFLLEALRRTAQDLERERAAASRAERQLQNDKIRALTTNLPALPDFSDFDPAFRATPTSPDGDIRTAFYAGYHDTDKEYVPLARAAGLLKEGRRLVSTTFVVPYPPGFPVLVPGQSISEAIIEFLIKLDVKEIHGYRPELGLSVFTEAALNRITADARSHPWTHEVGARRGAG
jgi:arginine decarboxylase